MLTRHDSRRFSLKYTPPPWFRRELRNLSPRLEVFWNDLVKAWEISEKVLGVERVAKNQWGIAVVVEPKYEKVLYTPGLGSRVLHWIKRNHVERYRTVQELDLETAVKPYL